MNRHKAGVLARGGRSVVAATVLGVVLLGGVGGTVGVADAAKIVGSSESVGAASVAGTDTLSITLSAGNQGIGEQPGQVEGVIIVLERLEGIDPRKPGDVAQVRRSSADAVSYTHLTLPTIHVECRSRWSPYH